MVSIKVVFFKKDLDLLKEVSMIQRENLFKEKFLCVFFFLLACVAVTKPRDAGNKKRKNALLVVSHRVRFGPHFFLINVS